MGAQTMSDPITQTAPESRILGKMKEVTLWSTDPFSRKWKDQVCKGKMIIYQKFNSNSPLVDFSFIVIADDDSWIIFRDFSEAQKAWYLLEGIKEKLKERLAPTRETNGNPRKTQVVDSRQASSSSTSSL